MFIIILVSYLISITCTDAISLTSSKPTVGGPLVLTCTTEHKPQVIVFYKPNRPSSVGGCNGDNCQSSLGYMISTSGTVTTLLITHVDISKDEGVWRCSNLDNEARIDIRFPAPNPQDTSMPHIPRATGQTNGATTISIRFLWIVIFFTLTDVVLKILREI